MGFSYLGDNKRWCDISRSERLFCCHLYWAIRNHEDKFVHYLNLKGCNLDEKVEWEIAFEVSLYRDFLKLNNRSTTGFHRSRTFDLCLFSKNTIVLLEAKAQRGFKHIEVKHFNKVDRNDIKQLLGNNVEILIIGLISSKYESLCRKKFNSSFDKLITWNEMYDLFSDEIFEHADNIYKK